MDHPEKSASLLALVKEVIENARSQVYRNTNSTALKMYWQIGQLIVEDEQQGKAKAVYGQKVLKQLSLQLTLEFGKGFEERNLNNMRAFYIAFPIWYAVRTELSWTHYRLISRIEDEQQRIQYIALAVEGNWDTRSLERNIRTQYIGRLVEPQNESELKPQHLLKDPYILEFLGIPQDVAVTENKIETAIINHLQKFLMELGKGFAFVARQQHIVTDSSDFFIDLVFYNYYLKCFVLIDLKTGKLTHEAIGQMDMYVRMYNDLKKREDDNPTLGIILCTEKDETIVKYSVLSENEKLFASKYRLYLPKEEELKQLIEADRIKYDLDHE